MIPSLRLPAALLILFALLPAAGRAAETAADPAALRKEIEALHLDPGQAVALKNVKLAAGLGTLQLADGVRKDRDSSPRF